MSRRVNVSAAVMRKIQGNAPKHNVGDRVAGCFSGLKGTVTRARDNDVRVKMDDGRVISQSPFSWSKC